MMILAPSVIFQCWANVLRTQYLIPAKRDKVYVNSSWIGALVNIVLNFIFIPLFYARGAALATLVAEVSVASYQTLAVRHVLPIKSMIKSILIYFIPGFIMVAVIICISSLLELQPILKLIMEVVVGASVYLVFAFPRLYKKYIENE